MLDYEETLNFLFNRLQSFHNDGATAYKPGLDKAYRLSAAFGNPHLRLRCIHVGGTNGKGSTAHTLASVLAQSGLKVGLYTSPHLVDFRERIRINGRMISREDVTAFVERFRSMPIAETGPSFFELTTIMAFEYFSRNNVDVAVIEVGLGGRLDTTNIINPLLSVITNISFDHTALLGDTLAKIAAEKAGIIRTDVPVVIGRRHPETDEVFVRASDGKAVFAQDVPMYSSAEEREGLMVYEGTSFGTVKSCLTGLCQPENMQTILTVLGLLRNRLGFGFTDEDVRKGILDTCRSTGLMGRWMHLGNCPTVIADTGHNPDGWKFIAKKLSEYNPSNLHIVIGFVNDKDYERILDMVPKDASYYFVTPSVNRAEHSEKVVAKALKYGLKGNAYNTVIKGYNSSLKTASNNPEAVIFVGGSTFVVADLLADSAFEQPSL